MAVRLENGKWRARGYNRYTGERPSFTANTKKEAERLARMYSNNVKGVKDMLLGDACDCYINNRTRVLSENTIKDYKNTRRLHLDGINNRPISSLTNETMQAWVNALADDLSPKSIRNCYSFVMASINALDSSIQFKVSLPMKVKPDIQIPNESDIRTILASAEDSKIAIAIKLSLACCLRRGEVAALLHHKECIKEDKIIIKYNMIKKNGKWISKSPKTFTSFREIPCPKELCEMARKSTPIYPDYITDRWIKYMKKLKLKFRFHDLRHASASLMMSEGIPIVDIEHFGGWRHGSPVLQTIYLHNVDESLKRSADKWQNKLNDFDFTAHFCTI